jgi:hypothetical protein
MAIMAGLFLILPMAFKSSAPKKEESVPFEVENTEIKAIEEETEEETEEQSKDK